MDVAAIMPCRGRTEQTIANVRRLLATVGVNPYAWQLHLVISEDDEAVGAVTNLCRQFGPQGPYISYGDNPTYWQALAIATADLPPCRLICNLANDLLPGRNWLARGIAAYTARFGSFEAPGLLGFNDGLHGPEHSSHFLISRALLERYGGWPVWYRHNFGDTELCRRAQQDGCYGKAAWAVLYHDHLENGAADDAVYQEGRATYDADARLFEERRRMGWPASAPAR